MENGVFAPKEQMLLFPKYFQIHDKSKSLLYSNGLNYQHCDHLNSVLEKIYIIPPDPYKYNQYFMREKNNKNSSLFVLIL